MSDPIANAQRVDSEPKSSTNTKSKSSSGPKSAQNIGKLGKSLQDFYGQLGMMLMPFDPQCASSILENAESMAQSMEQLAKENASVRRVLEKIAETSAVGTVFMAHSPVIMAIAGHHGPQIANMFSRKKPEEQTEDEGEKPETDTVKPETDIPLTYSHPGDNAA